MSSSPSSFLNLQTGVRRVALEKTIGALGVALGAEGQIGK
jgi:hypothetical protein